jgi:hypothetical protein
MNGLQVRAPIRPFRLLETRQDEGNSKFEQELVQR